MQTREVNLAETKSQETRGTVLITGGTEGLGRAAAVLLAERGYRVFAGGRNVAKLESLTQLARERKLSLEAIEFDVCNDASVEKGITEIERRAGPVDILVNNAGIAIAAMMEEITLDDLRKQFETNLFGVMRVTRRVLPEMRKRRRGRIINMSSISGKVAIPTMGPYAASKHALEAVSDALRLELYPFDIQVVLIEPGYIPTNMNRTAAELSSAYAKGAEQSPYAAIYQRFMSTWEKTRKASKYKPEDCAAVVLRAIKDTTPRARYAVTRRAKIGILAKRLLTDRAFDRQMKKTLKLDEVRASLAAKARK
jgi:NAD(P)-dependent dehydrogenase (short-subunit alcohol dehydrogenase family)